MLLFLILFALGFWISGAQNWIDYTPWFLASFYCQPVHLLSFMFYFMIFLILSCIISPLPTPTRLPLTCSLMYAFPVHIPQGSWSFAMCAFMKFNFINVDMLLMAQMASHSVSYYSIQLYSFEICLHCYLFHADHCLWH